MKYMYRQTKAYWQFLLVVFGFSNKHLIFILERPNMVVMMRI